MKILVFFIILFPLTIWSQDTTENSLVKWMTIQDAEKQFKKAPKPILIDVYTDWCGWCKHMMKTTYSNPNIAGYINTRFYPVRFDSETSDTVIFGGKTYTKKGKTNELGIELLNRQLSYPTTVFFSLKGQKYNIPGYLSPSQIEPFLVYFAENLVNNISLQEFNSAFMFTYPQNFKEEIGKLKPEQKPDTTGITKWYTFDEIKETKKNDKNKKYILFSNVSWCYSCKVMKKITFSNPVISEIINNNYYLINFDAATEKTIEINGTKYPSLGKGQPNQLAINIFQGKYIFPAIVFLDNNFQVITVVNAYLTPKNLEVILQYFSNDTWKTINFEDFNKNFESKLN